MTGQCYQSNQSSHSQGKHHNHRDATQPETNAGLLIFKWDAGVSQIMYLYLKLCICACDLVLFLSVKFQLLGFYLFSEVLTINLDGITEYNGFVHQNQDIRI